jgi:hypothetical protein
MHYGKVPLWEFILKSEACCLIQMCNYVMATVLKIKITISQNRKMWTEKIGFIIKYYPPIQKIWR